MSGPQKRPLEVDGADDDVVHKRAHRDDFESGVASVESVAAVGDSDANNETTAAAEDVDEARELNQGSVNDAGRDPSDVDSDNEASDSGGSQGYEHDERAASDSEGDDGGNTDNDDSETYPTSNDSDDTDNNDGDNENRDDEEDEEDVDDDDRNQDDEDADAEDGNDEDSDDDRDEDEEDRYESDGRDEETETDKFYSRGREAVNGDDEDESAYDGSDAETENESMDQHHSESSSGDDRGAESDDGEAIELLSSDEEEDEPNQNAEDSEDSTSRQQSADDSGADSYRHRRDSTDREESQSEAEETDHSSEDDRATDKHFDRHDTYRQPVHHFFQNQSNTQQSNDDDVVDLLSSSDDDDDAAYSAESSQPQPPTAQAAATPSQFFQKEVGASHSGDSDDSTCDSENESVASTFAAPSLAGKHSLGLSKLASMFCASAPAACAQQSHSMQRFLKATLLTSTVATLQRDGALALFLDASDELLTVAMCGNTKRIAPGVCTVGSFQCEGDCARLLTQRLPSVLLKRLSNFLLLHAEDLASVSVPPFSDAVVRGALRALFGGV